MNIKKFEAGWMIVALFVITAICFSFKKDEGDIVGSDGITYNLDAAKSYSKTFPLDSIKVAGQTIVNVPWNMASAYQYNYYLRLRKVSITPNLKVVLDQRCAPGSAYWSAIDSFSMTGADSTKLNFNLRGTNVYGTGHRLRFVNTGTKIIARNIEMVIKPTN